MTENGYVPVSSETLETKYPGVYAVGDVATLGVPKAGVFAEGEARAVADALIAKLRRRRATRRVPRARLVLHRVRGRTSRPRRHRLSRRAEADRHLPGAVHELVEE
jgi:NADPH-dependent 2,4-dienoyl-CoA reductase/sulfur reductase-like enzyme